MQPFATSGRNHIRKRSKADFENCHFCFYRSSTKPIIVSQIYSPEKKFRLSGAVVLSGTKKVALTSSHFLFNTHNDRSKCLYPSHKSIQQILKAFIVIGALVWTYRHWNKAYCGFYILWKVKICKQFTIPTNVQIKLHTNCIIDKCANFC